MTRFYHEKGCRSEITQAFLAGPLTRAVGKARLRKVDLRWGLRGYLRFLFQKAIASGSTG